MGEKPTIEVLEERVNNWMSSTTDYRRDLCRKIDGITKILTDLPCKERKAWYIGMGKQVAFMWIVITILFGVLIKDVVDKNSALHELKSIYTELKK